MVFESNFWEFERLLVKLSLFLLTRIAVRYLWPWLFCLWYSDTSLVWKESKSLDFFITESILNSELEGIFCIQLGTKDFPLQMHASFLLWNAAVWSFKGLFGLVFSITHQSIFITYHSKYVGLTHAARICFYFLFPSLISHIF